MLAQIEIESELYYSAQLAERMVVSIRQKNCSIYTKIFVILRLTYINNQILENQFLPVA